MGMVQHLTRPKIIDAPGQYRTRGGEVVTIDRLGIMEKWAPNFIIPNGWAHGHYLNGIPETWDVSGRVLPFSLSDNDIMEKVAETPPTGA